MTIRLHCAECQRKLKVPDEALGKKVQCPACGARFIGHIDSSPPTAPAQKNGNPPPVRQVAAAPFPDLALDEPAALEPIAEDPFVVDDPVMDVAEAVDESDAVEVEPEIVDEDEFVEKRKDRPKKKKSRGLLWISLALVAVVLLLVCGLGAYFAYLYLF